MIARVLQRQTQSWWHVAQLSLQDDMAGSFHGWPAGSMCKIYLDLCTRDLMPVTSHRPAAGQCLTTASLFALTLLGACGGSGSGSGSPAPTAPAATTNASAIAASKPGDLLNSIKVTF